MPTVESLADHEVLRFFGKTAYEDWRLLEAHFEWAAGSALLVLLLPGAAGAAICEQALAQRLAKDNRRLERIRFASIPEIIHLGERLLDLKVEGVGGVWVSFLSPDRADEAWKAACGKMFTLLNMHRNRILRALPVPLIFVGEPWLQQVFREAAPDFWSVRSTVVRLLPHSEPEESHLEGIPEQVQQSLIGIEAASDPDYILQQAHRLSHRSEHALQRVELLARAAAGFHENTRLELAESCWREALEALEGCSEKEGQLFIEVTRAVILNNLAIELDSLGNRREALAKAQEAVQIYDRLSQAEPNAILPDLASSLNTLANTLSKLGRHEEALAKAREAVEVFGRLSELQPEVFLPDLAMSLTTLANGLSDLGQFEEALANEEKAMRIYEQLAQTRPEAFHPALARSLNNIAGTLAALGRCEEALAKSQDAVRIRKRLAQGRPQAFLPDLAGSLSNLAFNLSAVGRLDEALAAAQEAGDIYQQLAKDRPDAFDPRWARSVTTKRACLKAMGDFQGSAAASRQALQILVPHFLHAPSAHAKLMASLVRNYLEDTKAIQQEPDMKLLGPIQEQLDKLNQSQLKSTSQVTPSRGNPQQ